LREGGMRKKGLSRIRAGTHRPNKLGYEGERCLNCGVCCECLQCVEACKAGAPCHDQKPRDLELKVGSRDFGSGF
jgi:heterodisulfide reductase subunit A-like polyferredoxin